MELVDLLGAFAAYSDEYQELSLDPTKTKEYRPTSPSPLTTKCPAQARRSRALPMSASPARKSF
jgi:hypothetical protein